MSFDSGMTRKPKIMIIGGASSLGSCLQSVLAEYGDVVTAGRSKCDVGFNLSDPVETMSVPTGIDVIIHAAAHFGGKSDEDTLGAVAVNVMGTLKVCQAAARAGVRHIVYISSMSACVEVSSPYYGIYALSKRHAEEVANLYCSTKSLPLTILRPSQIYGNSQSFCKHQPLIYAIMSKAETNEEIVLYGSHDALRNYIHVDDVSAIIAEVIKLRVTGTYGCMNVHNIRFSEIAQAAIAAFKSTSTIRFDHARGNIPDNIFPPDNALYERLGWYPKVSMAEGMARIAKWRRKGVS